MKEKLPDPDQVIKTVSQVTRLCLSLKKARLESEREELLSRYNSYLESQGQAEPPDHEAILIGFHECWLGGDFESILKTAKTLPEDFLVRHPEIQAYIKQAARK